MLLFKGLLPLCLLRVASAIFPSYDTEVTNTTTVSNLFRRVNFDAQCPFPWTHDDIDLPLGDDDGRKRAIAGRITHPAIFKRRASTDIKSFSTCTLTTPQGMPVSFPAYPGGNDFFTADQKGEIHKGSPSDVPRWYSTTSAGAPKCTHSLVKVAVGDYKKTPGDQETDPFMDHGCKYSSNLLSFNFRALNHLLWLATTQLQH